MRVVFDFGRVLFRWRPEVLLRQVLPMHAVDEASAAHWAAQVFQGYSGDWGEFDRGMVEPAELCERIARRTGLQPAQVQGILEAATGELQPMEPSVQLIERLHAAGMPLHYLSNMPAPFAEHLDRTHAVMARFKSGVYSSRVKLIKPDPAIFELAAAHFGAEPAELVFLDDHPANITAARNAGWRALLFSDAAQAEREMREQGWWPPGA